MGAGEGSPLGALVGASLGKVEGTAVVGWPVVGMSEGDAEGTGEGAVVGSKVYTSGVGA